MRYFLIIVLFPGYSLYYNQDMHSQEQKCWLSLETTSLLSDISLSIIET